MHRPSLREAGTPARYQRGAYDPCKTTSNRGKVTANLARVPEPVALIRRRTHTRFMGRYLPIIMVALLAIYCIVEVAQAPPLAVRRMPRWLWATAIICLPLAGSICWLFLGRPNAESLGTRKAQDRPKAPDDDVDFLRGL